MSSQVAQEPIIAYHQQGYREARVSDGLQPKTWRSPRWRLVFGNAVTLADLVLFATACALTARLLPYPPALQGAYVVAGAVGTLLAMIVLLAGRGYGIPALRAVPPQAMTILAALSVSAAAQGLILWTLQPAGVASATRWAVALFLVSGALIFSARLVIAQYVQHATKSGLLARRVAVVGATEPGYQIAAHVIANEDDATQLVGIFDDELRQTPDQHYGDGLNVPAFGRITDLVALSRRERIDAIVIALPTARLAEIDTLREQFRCVVADVYVAPSIGGPATPGTGRNAASLPHLGGSPVVSLMPRPLTDYQSFQKAIFDRFAAAVLLLILMPVLAVIALAIKLDSRGPVLFRQPRVGFNNVWFTVFKFRSMYHEMADLMADRQTSRDDPRVTNVGRILRKLSLDELPQLLNVLMGDMSLVGPRPHAPSTKAGGYLLDDAVPSYAERHLIKPGITGWAQVNGARGEIKSVDQIEERLRLDLHYMKNWSLFLDIKILFLTVKSEIISSRAF